MKYDIYERFAFIETRLLWGEGLSARELGEVFGLTRQTAQGVINAYRRQCPDSLRYDSTHKRHVATDDFQPRYIQAKPAAYLDHVRAEAMNAYYRNQQEWDELPFYDVDHLLRPTLKAEPTRVVLSALRTQQSVTIQYLSKKSARIRDFSPHTLVFAGNRYHLRGWCHLKQDFLDFVLSRIIQAELSDAPWFSARDDHDWNTYTELRFRPNERLSEEAQHALACDFPLSGDGIFSVNCRQALAFYLQRELTTPDPEYGFSRWIREN